MNEELKIIIKAITDEAQKNLEEVKKELQKINKEGKESGKGLNESMADMGKGVAVAMGAVAALTTAMAALGQKAQEVEKGIGKLKATFMANGSSATDATASYKELFGIFGEHDRAVETAQSLARVTTEADKLAEYYDILAGAASKYGDGLQGEALAEQISETIASGKAVGDLARVLVEAGISEDAFNASLAQTASLEERELLVRSTLNNALGSSGALYRSNNEATINYNKSQADLNIALANTAAYTTPLLTSLNNLGSGILTNLAPAIQTVAAYLTVFIEIIGEAIAWVGSFFGIMGGSDAVKGVQTAISGATGGVSGLESALGGATEQAKELKKQTAGFDELNVVSSQTASSGGATGGGGGGVSAGGMDLSGIGGGIDTSGLENFKEKLEEVRGKVEAILVLAGLAGGAFLGWKIGNALKDTKNLSGTLKGMAGKAMIIAGALLLIQSYSDAWVNGIDWGNFAGILAGIGLVVGGLALTVSPVAAAIGLVVGGIAMLVLGIKDIVENGYSMEAVITIAVGAILVLVGVVWALNSALLANPITWVVVAIMALVAAFIVLWNECDGFRQFFIDAWEAIKTAFNAVVEWLSQACADIAQFFTDLWQGIKDTFNAVVSFFTNLFTDAWEGIKNAFSSVKTFFGDVWQGIKDTFSGVVNWFRDIFSNAWAKVKGVFTAGGEVFGNIKEGIVSVFKTVVNGLITGINKVVKLPFEGLNGILNTIAGLTIATVKPFAWLTWRAPIPQLPMLATGGIATRDTLAHIGEQGYKEAVLPLERNTEWMDVLADRINGRGNTPSKIVLQLDGKELGWANINSINNITRQTGSLQLVMV